MGKPCCCNGCSCYSFEADSVDADDWIIVWDYDSQPQGADSITFNGTDVTIEIDWGNPDRADRAAIGVTLLHREWLANAWDVECPFFWGTKCVMEALNAPTSGCDAPHIAGFRWGVARIHVRDALVPDNIALATHPISWSDIGDAPEWRINNATDGISYEVPQRHGMERYGVRFEVQPPLGSTTGTVRWKISAPLEVKIGCCDLPRYELPAGFTNWDRAFVFQTDILWTTEKVVLKGDGYAPGVPCDPNEHYRNQPDAADIDLVATATGEEVVDCAAVPRRTWSGIGNIAVAGRERRADDFLWHGDVVITQLSIYDGQSRRSGDGYWIVNDPNAAAPDDWLIVKGSSLTGGNFVATWDPIGEIKTSDWVWEDAPRWMEDTDVRICPPDGHRDALATWEHRGPDTINCQYDELANDGLPRTYAWYDLETHLQAWANLQNAVTFTWDAQINRLRLAVQYVVHYSGNADQLIGLDASGEIVFTKNAIQSFGGDLCECPLPNTLTLPVLSMS